MGNSQTSVANDPDKPEPDKTKDRTGSSDYYYDDATGYEIYEDKDNDYDAEDRGSTNEAETES